MPSMFHQFVIHTVYTENYTTEAGTYHKSSTKHSTDKVGETGCANIHIFSNSNTTRTTSGRHTLDLKQKQIVI